MKNPSPRTVAVPRWLAAIALGAVTVAGCAAPGPRSTRDISETGPVGIVYELPATAAAGLLHQAGPVGDASPTRPASYFDGDARPLADPSFYARLELRESGENVRSRLTIRRKETPREAVTYELSLPRVELDFVLDDLESECFLADQERPNGSARLTFRRGDSSVTKNWTPEPRLEDLAERTLREGRRVPGRLPGGAIGRAKVAAQTSKSAG